MSLSPKAPSITISNIDVDYLIATLEALLEIPSPSGYTDSISRYTCEELGRIGVTASLTRRGAIRATLPGLSQGPKRAIVSHLDTLGAMVTRLKPNGRLGCTPIGTWSSRFAEGARVTIFTDNGHQRGTLMPLKASGHAYHDEIERQPITWENLEVRIDHVARDKKELFDSGFRVGDFIAIDPYPEFLDNGFIVSRHLDNKAGVACMMTAAKMAREQRWTLPIDCNMLFTIFEEVGSGASTSLHEDVAEMVSVDNAVNAPRQNSNEYDVTIAMKDSSGPFDYHLTHRLIDLAKQNGIRHRRDVFKHYRSDAASAVEAGNDIRTALVCFGVDGSHGYERTHRESLISLTRLICVYMQSQPAVPRDEKPLSDLKGFPEQHSAHPPVPKKRSPDSVGVPERPL